MPLGGGLILGGIAANAIIGGIKYFGGKKDQKKAEEEMAGLSTPFYKIQDEYYKNRNIAAQRAQGGFTAPTLNYLTTETQRGLGTGLSSLSQTGGSPSDASKLLSDYTRSIGNIAFQDSQLQTQNIDKYMEANRELAGQKTMQWSLNEYQPYQNKLKQLQQRIYASKQNQMSGLSDIGSSLSTAGSTFMNNNPFKSKNNNIDTPYMPADRYYNPNSVGNYISSTPRVTGNMGMISPNAVGMGNPSTVNMQYRGIPTPYAANPQMDYSNFNELLFGR